LGVSGTLSHCGAGLHAGWLNHIFVTPELHRWHHSAKVPKGHKFSVNYGVGFILWDRIFGTYYLPMADGIPVQPEKLGHPDGVRDEGNYFKLFFLARYLPEFLRPSKR
jgi:sterol desaturase/sphingolipid hydroxylase (fatty acid hydroxylase superfamily)